MKISREDAQEIRALDAEISNAAMSMKDLQRTFDEQKARGKTLMEAFVAVHVRNKLDPKTHTVVTPGMIAKHPDGTDIEVGTVLTKDAEGRVTGLYDPDEKKGPCKHVEIDDKHKCVACGVVLNRQQLRVRARAGKK